MNVSTLSTNTRIAGRYYGVAYTGTITAIRIHSANARITLIDVTLDDPIDVLDKVRDSLHLWSNVDGSSPFPHCFVDAILPTDEQFAAQRMVLWAIFSAHVAFDEACYWVTQSPDLGKALMVEYHTHVRIAYALNEAFGAGVDVYTHLYFRVRN